MRAQEGSLKCVAKVGTPLLKYKSNSDNPFPYGCCLLLHFSLMYYNSAKCLKSLHGSRFTSVFISALNECLSHLLLSLHLILVLFLFFFFYFLFFYFSLNIPFCGSLSLWNPSGGFKQICKFFGTPIYCEMASKFPPFKSESFMTALTKQCNF